MDKKQNFSRQGSSRALISEPRKSSDVFVRKSRSARKRENPNQSFGNYETQRSSKPAKFRPFVDKRPRARGAAGSQPLDVSSASSGLAECDEALDGLSVELNSIYNNQGSNKQNLNHLLNFHYAPREHDGSVNASFFGRNGNRNHLKKQKYNKEQFLQANFQFVVKSSAESSIVSASPDTLVDWTLIEQINIQTTEEPQCPICLYPPVAAKLTRCGHAYCWPCVLHYLALTDKNWRKCPICYDAIHLSDLKSTAIVQQANIKVSNFVTLQLMRRKKGSMFIEKVGDEEHNQKIPHIAAELDKKTFSKFLLADPCEILSIIERERQELVSCSSEDCPEFVFIQQALDLLTERKSTMLKEMGAIETGDGEEISLEKVNLDEDKVSPDETLEKNLIDAQAVKVMNVTHQPISLESASKEMAKYYYFYQSLDGQNVFLHPLNVKMLQAMYGCLEKAPPLLKAQVLQKEFQSMDENHRKKFTCLSHLPLTCQFEIVEVQLEPPIVSEEILTLFRDDIMLRQKTRMRRAREEKKREKQIFEINERQMGKVISRFANIDIQSSQQFPMCGSDDGSVRSSFGEPISFDLLDSPPAALPTSSKSNYTSFANILSSPKKELWPSLGGIKNTLPNASEAVWGKSTVTISANTSAADLTSDPNFLDESALPLRQNLGDVLAEALQQKMVSADGNSSEKKTGASKKVKKCKKTLLLSTGMSFGGK